MIRPFWSSQKMYNERMPVDHIIEWQVRPLSEGGFIDEPWNFELLEATANSQSGSQLKSNIQKERKRLASETNDQTWMSADITFTEVISSGDSSPERWSEDEIINGDHIAVYETKVLSNEWPEKSSKT
jgi:hypothetical protein